MKWQPIKTAPKNGSEILVCNVNQGGVRQLVSWNQVYHYWQCKGEVDLHFQWTHWISIPPSPVNGTPPEKTGKKIAKK